MALQLGQPSYLLLNLVLVLIQLFQDQLDSVKTRVSWGNPAKLGNKYWLLKTWLESLTQIDHYIRFIVEIIKSQETNHSCPKKIHLLIDINTINWFKNSLRRLKLQPRSLITIKAVKLKTLKIHTLKSFSPSHHEKIDSRTNLTCSRLMWKE